VITLVQRAIPNKFSHTEPPFSAKSLFENLAGCKISVRNKEVAMPIPDREFLLHRMDETRLIIEKLLPEIDPRKEIYPGWTIRDMLAHMTGWDDATIDSLRAHVVDRPPSVSAIRSLDEYNALTVSSRQDLDYDQVLREWRLTRQVLRTIIEQLPEDKFFSPLIVPWGEKATVTYLVDMFRDHEEEHTRDILAWLKDSDKPIVKEGG
jgi:hypothetical protein